MLFYVTTFHFSQTFCSLFGRQQAAVMLFSNYLQSRFNFLRTKSVWLQSGFNYSKIFCCCCYNHVMFYSFKCACNKRICVSGADMSRVSKKNNSACVQARHGAIEQLCASSAFVF
jgi:hypothetical protein